jgi:hypothetical protein
LATGRHRELLCEAAPTIAAYAQRHGWSVVLSSETLGDRPASWSKLLLVRELLQSYEVVFWVDADALIVDLDRDIVAELSNDHDIWFAHHPQERNPDATVLNAGIFVARSSPFTFELFDAMWANERFIDHNWWENAALLDLLGYSLEPPFPKLRDTKWDARIGQLDLAWNSVPGYCESPAPALNHHARSDHDDFTLRLMSMADDRAATEARFPEAFTYLRSPSSAGVDHPPRRTHDFDGLDFGAEPTVEELRAVLDQLDAVNETYRLRLIAAFDQLEDAVTAQVAEERRAITLAAERDDLARRLDALHKTKLFRVAAPARELYARVRNRIRG